MKIWEVIRKTNNQYQEIFDNSSLIHFSFFILSSYFIVNWVIRLFTSSISTSIFSFFLNKFIYFFDLFVLFVVVWCNFFPDSDFFTFCPLWIIFFNDSFWCVFISCSIFTFNPTLYWLQSSKQGREQKLWFFFCKLGFIIDIINRWEIKINRSR